MADQQRTISRPAEIAGVGLHTGQTVTLRFVPSEPHSGIRFVRTDLVGKPTIPADIAHLIDVAQSPRRTSVGIGDVMVQTIEHLMASLWGLEIDNLLIEINGDEIPGMDGSAMPFIQTLTACGLQDQPYARRTFAVREPLWTEHEGTSLTILPSNEFRVSYMLSYDHPLLRAQYTSFFSADGSFAREIAPARTFCLQQEAEGLRRQGLGKGATYDNTLVLGADGVIKNRLRFEDECARHKILDLIGDLYLLGVCLRGHIIAIKSGHPLNLRFIQRLHAYRQRQFDTAIRAGEIFPGATQLDIAAIQRILPHRFPFLMVDRIIELEEDRRAVGIKNVTINDYFFPGHFPDRPVMPGVMIIEALAQVGGVLLLNKPENAGKYAYFTSMDRVKFRRAVVPGDQLVLEVELTKMRSRTGQVETTAYVDGKVVAEGQLMFTLVDA